MKSLYKYLLSACCYQVLETFPTNLMVHRHQFLSSSFLKKLFFLVPMSHVFVACSIFGWLFKGFHYKTHLLFLIQKAFMGRQLFVIIILRLKGECKITSSFSGLQGLHSSIPPWSRKGSRGEDKKYKSISRCGGWEG